MSLVQAENWSIPIAIISKEADRAIIAPSLSADGNKIAFYATVGYDMAIFVVNWDGTGLKQLHQSSMDLSYPSISGKGDKVAFSSNRLDDSIFNHQSEPFSDIIVTNSYGTKETVVASNLASYYDYGPCISADGRKVAFVSNSALFVVNSDGTGMRQLSSNVLYSPAISGDGSKVAFISEEGYDRTLPFPTKGDIFVINSDGTERTMIVSNLTLPVSELSGSPYRNGPSISEDGTKVAFSASVEGDSEIFVVNFDGTALTQITDNLVNEWAASISGDGSKVVFSSQLYDINDVFVVNSDGTGLTEITSNQSLIAYLTELDSPCISSDGNRIAFSFWLRQIFVTELKEILNPPEQTALPSATPFNSEPPSITLLVIASGAGLAVLSIGLLVYLKKRKH